MDQLVVLTGMTGKTGRHCLKRMMAEPDALTGLRFRALVRESSDTSLLRSCGLPMEIAAGSFEDDAFLEQALCGADTLLHTAGIHWSEKIVSAALKNGVKRVLAVHTTGIYSRYKHAGEGYRQIDASVERMCAECGASLTLLRPTMVYGSLNDQNMCKFIRMVDRLPVIPVVSGGRFALQPVHERDLGNAYFEVFTHPAETDGKAYVLSGEKPVELRDALSEIAQALGKKPRFVSMPFFMAYGATLALYGLSFTKLDLREKVQRLVEPRAYSHEQATADFGYAPMSFREGIAEEVAAYRVRGEA